MSATPTPLRPAAPEARRRFARRHTLMLALAGEIVVLGALGARADRGPGIVVEPPLIQGHVIT